MSRPIHGFLALLLMVAGAGCAGTRGGPGSDHASPLPELSLSMTRTVPDSVVTVPDPVVAVPATAATSDTADTGITFYRLQVGDPVVIHLRGIFPKDEAVEDVIDEEGNVTIPHIGDIPAVGKSTSQLEGDIVRMYIEGGYYRSITVNVVMPARSYFIRGEVRNPGRFPVAGGLTIMQAIAAAGGYTEFASPRNVKLIRGGTTQNINMRRIERNPEQDVRLESGDVIVVERSIL